MGTITVHSLPIPNCYSVLRALECHHLTGHLLLDCSGNPIKAPGAEQMFLPEHRALSQTAEQEARRSPGAEVPRKPSDCAWCRMPQYSGLTPVTPF